MKKQRAEVPTDLLMMLANSIAELTEKFDSFEATVTNKIDIIEKGYEKLEAKVVQV